MYSIIFIKLPLPTRLPHGRQAYLGILVAAFTAASRRTKDGSFPRRRNGRTIRGEGRQPSLAGQRAHLTGHAATDIVPREFQALQLGQLTDFGGNRPREEIVHQDQPVQFVTEPQVGTDRTGKLTARQIQSIQPWKETGIQFFGNRPIHLGIMKLDFLQG